MTRVALVTCAEWPDGDVDDHLLVHALRDRGVTVEYACWDDTDARWSTADVAVVRSTWDYHERPAAFVDWTRYVATLTTLYNEPRTIEWNIHKSYLLDLSAAGLPIVPTDVVRRGDAYALGSTPAVVKPAISVGALRTTRFATQADLDAITAVDDALVQPYLREIETHGEVSIICVEGVPTHAVRKVPAHGDFRSQEHHGAACDTISLTSDLYAIADAALAAAPGDPLYARVDVVVTDDGPLLMELELIEPTLWLRWHPPAAGILADAIIAAG